MRKDSTESYLKSTKKKVALMKKPEMYAKLDCKNSIGFDIDSAEKLYKNSLKDFDLTSIKYSV